MGIFDPEEVITVYSLKQAIEDGVLVEICRNRWGNCRMVNQLLQRLICLRM
jgi:hypothetical protein